MIKELIPTSSLVFFYVFFGVLIIVFLYGVWETLQKHHEIPSNPLTAIFVGIPESISLFDTVWGTLRISNKGRRSLKNIYVLCGSSWTFSLGPGGTKDVPIRIDTYRLGNQQVNAHIYCKPWELRVVGWYRVFQKIMSQKNRYYSVLGLKPGATRQDIRKARNRLAKQFHPDMSPGYEEKMKEINEAYKKLMSLQKK
jgi:hypothetical protein